MGSGRYAEDGQIAAGRSLKMGNGHARTPDHFVANVGDNESGLMHPAMFPATLCEKLILTFSKEDQRVADIFCGSGQTLVAAQRLGRRWIGFDSKREYVEIAAKRLNTTFTEKVTVINHGPVRLRTEFPDTAKCRRLYFQSRNLNASDAAVFEFILSMTVRSDERKAAAELSHNHIAAATKLSRRTVIRSVERLEKAGLIETQKHEQWHRGNANRIAVASSLLVALETDPSATHGGNGRGRGTRLSRLCLLRQDG